MIGGTDRFYRDLIAHCMLTPSFVTVEETDLMMLSSAPLDIELVKGVLLMMRSHLKAYGSQDPRFFASLLPIEVDSDAPLIAQQMCEAARLCNVGPMAAVAGAMAQTLGRSLANLEHLIIENGGDIYMRSTVERSVLVYAGPSPLSGRFAVVIPPGEYGVCTSAGSFGHSLSFGKADAALVVARDACLADAAATALGNMVKTSADLEKAVATVAALPGVIGALSIIGDKLGISGELILAAAQEVRHERH